MHIPDGYLSPATTLPALAAMVPVWGIAARKVKKSLSRRQVPLLGLCAAFSFVIMMFNIPVVGGTSAHAVGAVFIAILLGPWAACISISTAIFIQALVFGDGGILAFGVNCFNMAFVMPFVGYAIYRLIAGRGGARSKRAAAGAFIGSYIGINAAAFFAAVEFGIQPLLFKAANGTPLYCPYPLSVSIPSMLFAHGLFAGPLEGIITAASIVLIIKFSPDMFKQSTEPLEKQGKTLLSGRYKVLFIILAVLIVLTPIGLIASGDAWGEWGNEHFASSLGYVPQGLAKISGWWKALLPDYTVNGTGNVLGYIISAAVGVLLILLIAIISSKIMHHFRKAEKD